jgi:hypothetical protein
VLTAVTEVMVLSVESATCMQRVARIGSTFDRLDG